MSAPTPPLTLARKVGAIFFIPLVMFHAMVGIGLLPLFVVQRSPESPLARLTLWLFERFGLYGFVGCYILPMILLCGWCTWSALNVTARPAKPAAPADAPSPAPSL